MFKFDKTDIQRVAVSAAGAVALSAACIFGVAGPARAGTVQVKEWKGQIEKQLDDGAPVSGNHAKIGEAHVAVRFNDQGRYAGAKLVKSSNDAEFDQEAVRTAARIDYPALAGSQVVTLRLLNNASPERVAIERAKDAMTVRYAAAPTGTAKVNAK